MKFTCGNRGGARVNLARQLRVGMRSGGARGARQPMPGSQAVKIKGEWGLLLLLWVLRSHKGWGGGLWARAGSFP